MIAALVVVFREVIEAALIVGIVLAACRGIAGARGWVAGGIAGGLLGAVLVAIFAGAIADLASGMGQELFNATVLVAAVAMLAWHSIWMARHGRALAAEVGAVGKAVVAGQRPLYAVAIVVGVAVLREGAETVLFLYSIAVTDGSESAMSMLAGGFAGVALGVALGAAMYLGLTSIPARRLFSVTNVLILLLAAGLASQAAALLAQAGLVPSFGETVWDTSWLLAGDGIAGRIFHTLVGYDPRPAGVQVLAYLATLVAIMAATRIVARSLPPRPVARHA